MVLYYIYIIQSCVNISSLIINSLEYCHDMWFIWFNRCVINVTLLFP